MSPTTLQLLLLLVVVVGLSTAAPGVLGGGKHHRGVLSTPVRLLKPDVRVSRLGGAGTVASVGDALKLWKEPTGASKYFVIHVTAGTYDEYLTVVKTNVVLIGDGADRTIITGNRSDKTGHDVKQSATMSVLADHFMARDVTIQNTAGGPDIQQAVALLVEADKCVFYRCHINGYQDTLWAAKKQHFYRECQISGTIDFIFGDAMAVFQDCLIYIRRPPTGKDAVITAQARDDHFGRSGFVLQNCTIMAAPQDSLDGVLTYLGRPWMDHATVVFMLCSIDDIVHADGWVVWDKTKPNKPVKGYVKPGHEGHTFYASFGNHGIGANLNHIVEWHGFQRLNEAKARQYTPGMFIQGVNWLPDTGVQFYLGLRDGE